MNVRLNSRVMLFVCLGLGWSGEGWAQACYFDCDGDNIYSDQPETTMGAFCSGAEGVYCDPAGGRCSSIISSKGASKTTTSKPEEPDIDCDDCDGAIAGQTEWWEDADSDGYGDPNTVRYACGATMEGYVVAGETPDCEAIEGYDPYNDPLVSPDGYWIVDEDGDGWPTAVFKGCEPPDTTYTAINDANYGYNADLEGYITNGDMQYLPFLDTDGNFDTNKGDCNDDSGAGGEKFYPGASENINSQYDYDCSATCWAYPDGDGDGYAVNGALECEVTIGNKGDEDEGAECALWIGLTKACIIDTSSTSVNSTRTTNDCNDSDDSLNPKTEWWADSDRDGFGTSSKKLVQCDPPTEYVQSDPLKEDCRDDLKEVNPEETEGAGVDIYDNDCNSTTDCNCYTDEDEDGFGTATIKTIPGSSDSSCDCLDNKGAFTGGDCEDSDDGLDPPPGDRNPDAIEVCEGEEDVDQVDNDCNGSTSTYGTGRNELPATNGNGFLNYASSDRDGDGYGEYGASNQIGYCGTTFQPTPATNGASPSIYEGYSKSARDCNDGDDGYEFNPGAIEICDGLDNDCDGFVDEPYSQTLLASLVGLKDSVLLSDTNNIDEVMSKVGCTLASVDVDRDGQGSTISTIEPLCLCEAYSSPLSDCPTEDKLPSEYSICSDLVHASSDDPDCGGDGTDTAFEDGCCGVLVYGDCIPTVGIIEQDEGAADYMLDLQTVYNLAYADGYALFSWDLRDCDDRDASVLFDVGAADVVDGKDSNCTSSIPIAEFDCDMDGFAIGGGASIGEAYARDEGCTADKVEPITCKRSQKSDEWIPTNRVCQALALGTGADSYTITQWVILTNDSLNTNLLTGGTKRSDLPTGVGDCDDLCSTRSPGEEESCDGLDNDCTLTRPEDCTLEKALNGECAGTVCEDEADPDGDGAISCNPDAEMICTRDVQTTLQCDGTAKVFRGDPKAYCTRATPYKNSDDPNASGVGVDARCDGVDAAPYGLPYEGEVDGDRDGHYACGPQHNLSGDELGGSESVFVLMYFADDKGYPDDVNAVPLLYPRAAPGGGVLPSDLTLARRLLEDLDKLDWATSDEAADPLRPITHGQRVVGDPFSGAVDGVQGATSYPTVDPLFELCVRAEICATQDARFAPEWCATGPVDDGLSGRCAVVEMKLSEARGLQFDPPDAADSDDQVGADSPSDSGPADVFVGAPIAGELAGRLVWPQARIVESRRRVVEWDCFLTFGTYGCGALIQPADLTTQLARFRPSTLGATRPYRAPLDAAMSDTRWWKELGRYYDGTDDSEVAVVVTETILSCWGNPTVEEDLSISVHDRVGGDCRDGDGRDDPPTHRDALEGPDDVLGLLTGEQVDCDTCEDGLDNNCDGLTDCEDPGCAPCWVGQGGGLGGCSGADPEAPCGSSGGCSAGRGVRSPWPSLGELGLLLLAALGLPLYRRGVK